MMTLSTKMAREEIYFLCICITLVILMSILNVLTHLIKLLFYSGYQCMHCTGLAVRAIQCKVVFVFKLIF